MSLQSLLVRPGVVVTLFVLILFTRTNGSSLMVNPPDATLGAFFLAGLFAPSVLVFALLFGAGALADWFSFQLGVTDWCFTPAYWFLIPTYGCLWFAGYHCRKINLLSIVGAWQATGLLAVATTAAYLISTYSFFWFSGRIVNQRQIEAYEAGILQYFPTYIGWAFFYAALGLAVAWIMRSLHQRDALAKHG